MTGTASAIRTGIAGAIAMAAAMGFGRFFFTPVLPAMMADLGLDAADAGFIASANFFGYLAGAVLASYGWAAGHERRIAIGALIANTVLLLLTAMASGLPALAALRFLAGLASAFAMIFTSGIVLSHGLALKDGRVQMLHFGGVGAGIALSALVVYLVGGHGLAGLSDWRIDWLAAFALTAVSVLVVHWLLPAGAGGISGGAEPRLRWTPALAGLTLSYGIFGAGYVVTATFIVAIVRDGAGGALLECLAWLVTGVAAAVSLRLWRPFEQRFGLLGAYRVALVLECLGVLATVFLGLPVAALAGGLALGGTFMVVTAFGLQLGRRLQPEAPRRVLATMTAAFGVGQIVGPLMAGALATGTGGYGAASLAAAVLLALAAIATFPAGRASH